MLPGQIEPTSQLQHNVGQPSAGQPMQANGVPGQSEFSQQPVYIHGASWQPKQQQQVRAWTGGFKPNIDIGFLKSPRFFVKIAEFVALLTAWASLLKYAEILGHSFTHDSSQDYVKQANFFKGITVFSWLVVIAYTIIYIFSLPETFKCCRPSTFTMTSVCFWFGLLALLLASTGNLVRQAVVPVIGKFPSLPSNPLMEQINALNVALAFGFLSCILFVVDMVLNYKEFQVQRAQEQVSPEQVVQGEAQRRVWDINHEFLRSSVFYIKLAEMVLLLVAWACIVKYVLDVPTISYNSGNSGLTSKVYSFDDWFTSKVNIFKGFTVFVWVMVVLLVLTVVFSFDKICGRSSSWTLMIFVVYIILTISLVACCGSLSHDMAKYFAIGTLSIKLDSRVIALAMGLTLGYLSWIVFIGDLALTYQLYKRQKDQESPQQRLPVQQPGVMMVPQRAGNQQVYQPAIQPCHQLSQYHGQQPVVIGVMQPSGYNPLQQQQQQQPTQ